MSRLSRLFLSRDSITKRLSLASFHYRDTNYRFNEYDIGNEWNFHLVDAVKEFKSNTTIRIAIASQINDDDGYYMIYIPNDDPDDVIIRKLQLESTNTITKVFIIDGPILIIQRQHGSIEVINLFKKTNSNRSITMNEFNLIEAKAYEYIDTSSITESCICLLHFINNSDGTIAHKWLCFDIYKFISSSNDANSNDDDNDGILLFSPPYVNSSIMANTITGIHYFSKKMESSSSSSISTIITTSSGFLYSIVNNGTSNVINERKLDDDSTNTTLTTIKTAVSAIPNTTSIIVKHKNSDKLMVFSMSSLSLLLEVRNVGFFVIGNFISTIYTHLLIAHDGDDTSDDSRIILNKTFANGKSQFTLCEMPGLTGSRYMTILSDGSSSSSSGGGSSSSNWHKRSSLITCGDIITDKKRKKNNKDNKKQKSDNPASVNTKKQLSDIDTKSQESVIDALDIHLQKLVMTSGVMNNSIDHKKLLLQVLRKNVMGFQSFNSSSKLDFAIVDNNLSYLYPDKHKTSRCSKDEIHNCFNDKVILMDAAYVKVANNSSILLFVRIFNKSNMPIFRVKTNVSLISSEQGYMRESKSVFTKSGNVDIVYPNHEAIISSMINISNTPNDYDDITNSNLARFSNNTVMSINLSWTEFKTPRSNNINLNKLNHLFSSDPVRLDIEMSNGWLGEASRNGVGGAMIITSKTDTNVLIMTPFLIAKHCTSDSNISIMIRQWYHDASLNNRKVKLVSFMCNLPLILIGDNRNIGCVGSNSAAEKLAHFISTHFYNPECCPKSNLYIAKADVPNENELIKTMCLSGFDMNDLYDELTSMRNTLLPECSLLLFSNNNENLEILRLVSVYLLDEMAILAAAWRMMILEKTSKKRKSLLNDSNKSNFQLRINPRLITPSAVAKVIYLKQQKTDRILSFALARLNPFL